MQNIKQKIRFIASNDPLLITFIIGLILFGASCIFLLIGAINAPYYRQAPIAERIDTGFSCKGSGRYSVGAEMRYSYVVEGVTYELVDCVQGMSGTNNIITYDSRDPSKSFINTAAVDTVITIVIGLIGLVLLVGPFLLKIKPAR